MNEYEMELAVGDVICMGDHTVTVVEIDGPHVSFRINHDEELVAAAWGNAENAPQYE